MIFLIKIEFKSSVFFLGPLLPFFLGLLFRLVLSLWLVVFQDFRAGVLRNVTTTPYSFSGYQGWRAQQPHYHHLPNVRTSVLVDSRMSLPPRIHFLDTRAGGSEMSLPPPTDFQDISAGVFKKMHAPSGIIEISRIIHAYRTKA